MRKILNQLRSDKFTSSIFTAAVLLIVISINLGLNLIFPKFASPLDLTKNKIYALSNQTQTVLDHLEKDVHIFRIVLADNEGYIDDIDIAELLNKYLRKSSKLVLERVDIDKNPAFGRDFLKPEENLQPCDFVFVCENRHCILRLEDLVSIDGLVAEQKFTSAIDYVVSDRDLRIGVTTGHGELVDMNTLNALFRSENYGISLVNLETDDLEDEITTLMVIKPRNDFEIIEIEKIRNFVDKGNGLVLCFDIAVRHFDRLDNYLMEYGMAMNEDYVIEMERKNLSDNGMIPNVNEHGITRELIGKNLKIPGASSIKIIPTEGIEITTLLETSAKAFGKTNFSSSARVKEESDISGPLNLSSVATKSVLIDQTRKSAKVIIIPLGLMAYVRYVPANDEFLLGTMNWFNEREDRIFIPPKVILSKISPISNEDYFLIDLILFGMPFIVMLCGVLVLFKRKYT